MNATIIPPIALAIASHALGQTIQIGATNPSALTSEHLLTITVECAVTADALFAGQISLEAASDDFRIAAATGSRTFESVHQATEGSERRFEACQRLVTLDRTLGSGGEPVPFATIELEIPHNRPFKSRVWISGNVTQIGGQPIPATMEFVGDQPEGGSVISSDDGKRLFIPIRRIAPESPPSTEIPPDEWFTETASVSVSIQPSGGGAATTTLTAGNEYELHYDAGENQISSYVLFFAGEDAAHSVTATAPAASGDWSDTGFFSVDLAASGASAEGGLSEGFVRNAQVFDMRAPGFDRAASTGHLLNFTPQAAGSLGIELYMQLLDPEQGRAVEMQKSLVLDVQSAE